MPDYDILKSEPEVITLDASSEFERAVTDMVLMHREKSAAYRTNSDPLSNFYETARITDSTPLDVCEVLLAKHSLALMKWRKGVRDPNKYSQDGHLDRAVYSVIAMCLYNRGSYIKSEGEF